jgi:hypothetical protein
MDLDQLREAIVSGDPSRAMPALAALREVPEEQAVPLLLLGLEQSTFMVRSLSCAGLGVKRNEAGWLALVQALERDEDANVRAEAANALVSHSLQRAWPLLLPLVLAALLRLCALAPLPVATATTHSLAHSTTRRRRRRRRCCSPRAAACGVCCTPLLLVQRRHHAQLRVAGGWGRRGRRRVITAQRGGGPEEVQSGGGMGPRPPPRLRRPFVFALLLQCVSRMMCACECPRARVLICARACAHVIPLQRFHASHE